MLKRPNRVVEAPRLRLENLIPLFLLLLIATVSGAGEVGATVVLAEVRLDPAGIRLDPTVEAVGWALTVSGPEGFYTRREFRGSAPELSFEGEVGNPPPDGPYTWELRALPDEGRAQSGHFRLRDGLIVQPDPSLREGSSPARSPGGEDRPTAAAALATHPDGVIVDNGLIARNAGCLGNDCTDGEVLALLGLKLKSNNPNLKFEDTSTPGEGFASTDWLIRIGDSTVGPEFFRIEELDTGTEPFTIEGGAADYSIWVDETGRVGIGTATPAVKLHVQGNARVTGNFTVLSSREAKAGIERVDASAVLRRVVELPLAEWSLTASPGERHLGPMAEDFRAAFGLGHNEHYLSPGDLAGVALAALQGLHREMQIREIETGWRLEAKASEIVELRRDRDDLAARLAALEEAFSKLGSAEGGLRASSSPETESR